MSFYLSELRFCVWSLCNSSMDRYVIRQREQLKEDLTKMIEKKGPEFFGSEDEFEKKRVLKDGAVSMKRVNTSMSLKSFLPETVSFGNLHIENLAQDVIPQIFY